VGDEKREPISNEIITAAERVLRELNDGREPYAPSVMPMARALAKLAHDPQFILAAAEAILREAGAKRMMLLGAPYDALNFVELGDSEFSESVTGVQVTTVDADSLPVAYAKLKAARNG
jgi:hypothetical protein